MWLAIGESIKVRKERDVLEALEEYKGCWVSARFVKNRLKKKTRVSGAIGVGKILSRIGFRKRKETTAPKEFFIDDIVFRNRATRLAKSNV